VAPDLPSSSAPRNHDNVTLRPESDVAPVPVQTSNATIAITLSPPATKGKTALDNHGKKKPILYLHAGPPKTATSTIQAKLFEHQKNPSLSHTMARRNSLLITRRVTRNWKQHFKRDWQQRHFVM